jgi:hypothetical protein
MSFSTIVRQTNLFPSSPSDQPVLDCVEREQRKEWMDPVKYAADNG